MEQLLIFDWLSLVLQTKIELSIRSLLKLKDINLNINCAYQWWRNRLYCDKIIFIITELFPNTKKQFNASKEIAI